MFRGFFNKHDDKDDIFEQTDPIVERRRQEKFSSPLLYDEEFKNEEESVNLNQVVSKTVKKETKIVDTSKSNYQMYQIISPMHGATNKEEPIVQKAKTPVQRTRKTDNLVPVISPFFGATDNKVTHEDFFVEIDDPTFGDITVEIPVLKEEFMTHTNPTALENTGSSVEENLRNMALMTQEEQNELKIIEERTGEFRLDLSKQNQTNKSKPLIDEIEDDMSLDDLMSLYEKKFTD